jgi:hypothetical protein
MSGQAGPSGERSPRPTRHGKTKIQLYLDQVYAEQTAVERMRLLVQAALLMSGVSRSLGVQ